MSTHEKAAKWFSENQDLDPKLNPDAYVSKRVEYGMMAEVSWVKNKVTGREEQVPITCEPGGCDGCAGRLCGASGHEN